MSSTDTAPSDVLSALVHRVSPLIHSERQIQAAQIVADVLLPEPFPITSQKDATTVLRTLVYRCLHQGYLDLSAELLWPTSFFTPEPRSVKMIWRNIRDYPAVLLMGGSSMSKTYTPGVMFYLEWQRDPEYTNVVCVGPSEEHLEANLFSHLVKLHQNTSIPMPGEIGKRWIGLDTRNRRAGIRGVVIPVGRKAAGRIQGTKRHPRPVPHPIFGRLSRLFLLFDELENVPAGVYSDVENVMSASGEEADGFKLVGAYNPKDPTLKPYQMAEPIVGWEHFDPERDEEWTSKLDYRVVRLDALRSENVVTGKVIYTGLQTKIGYDKTVKAAGGVGSPGYWTFGRGCYPPLGSTTSCIPSHYFDQQVGEVVFIDRPASVGGGDLALEGGDHVQMGHGLFGRASGVIKKGVFVPFLDVRGRPITRQVLQFMDLYPLPRAETTGTAKNVKVQALTLGIRPQALMLDRTGNGSGVHDVLKAEWNMAVRGVNYSQAPTSTKVLMEDTETADQRFPRIDSELIFAARDWMEHGYLWLHPNFDRTIIREQLSQRQARAERGMQRAESKSDFKARHQGHSPDESDAFCLTVHAVRVNFAPAITAVPNGSQSVEEDDGPQGYTDMINKIDWLD